MPLLAGPEAKKLLLALVFEARRNIKIAKFLSWAPYRWQIQPDKISPGGVWLIMGGRGIGKTDGCAHATLTHVNGPACDERLPGGHRISIIAPTLGDGVEACVNGPSGLRAYDSEVRLVSRTGGTFVIFPNGTEAKIFGAYGPEDVERLRAGGNRCFVWAEEIAAWKRLEECWKHMRFGLRIGPNPYIVGSTTPKPRPFFRKLLADAKTVVTHGTTAEAHHLAQEVRDQLYADYAGTRLGRQELSGEVLADIEGALWNWELIEANREPMPKTGFARIVVAIDPAGGSAETNDETGIIVCGKDDRGHGYVLADRSGRYKPHDWARVALEAYYEFGADRIVAEVNFGADMVEATIRAVDTFAAFTAVHASRAKRQRAEPISAMYEKGIIHHTQPFEALEEQMTTWVPDGGTSPDRMDALVWALTNLMQGQSLLEFARIVEQEKPKLAESLLSKFQINPRRSTSGDIPETKAQGGEGDKS